MAKRLEQAKEEGIIAGQKQTRTIRDEEIKKIGESLKQYKIQCAALRKKVEDLEKEKQELEEYNE